MRDVEGHRQRRGGFAVGEPLADFLLLSRGELVLRPPGLAAGRLHAGASLGGARQDHLPLDLGHATHDSQHHLALGRAGVGPRLSERAEAPPGLVDALDDRKQVEQGSRQPVDPSDHHHIPRLNLSEEAVQLAPVATLTTDLLSIDRIAPRCRELLKLHVERLPHGPNAGLSEGATGRSCGHELWTT